VFRLSPDGSVVVMGGTGGSLADQPPRRFAAVGDRLYAAFPYFGGWRLEGAEGWGPDGSNVVTMASPEMVAFDGRLYFIGVDAAHGAELWSTDAAGRASLFKDVYPGEVSGFDFAIPIALSDQAKPPLLAVGDGKLFFVARDRDHGRHLFQTDGTPEGTRVTAVTDQRAEGVSGSMPTILLGTEDNLYFASNHYRFGRELFGLHPDATPPRVTTAVLRSGAGGPAFAVTFSEDVGDTLNAFDFLLARETAAGPRAYDAGLLHLNYDPATRTATIRPVRPLPDGRYVLSVPDGSAITDAAYNPLEPRELLRFASRARPGDANGDGRVNALDVLDVRRRLGTAAGDPGYTFGADVNGDGRINALDLAAVRMRLNTTAPPAPLATATAAVFGVTRILDEP
jgi:ELWxxDGT repeat protein